MTTTAHSGRSASAQAAGSARTAPARARQNVRGFTGPERDRLSRAGRPIRAALLRVPFVIALLAVLAGGVALVLFVNTKTDESGMRTEKAKAAVSQLRLEVEALNREIAVLSATPHIAQQAKELGLVPAGDAAILVVDEKGRGTLIGEPGPAGAGAADRGGDGGQR